MIRVALPPHLRTFAQVDGEVALPVEGAVTQRSVLDALEARYPALRGTIRDHVTQRRRPFVRFFACGQDLSHEPPDAPLPEAVASGTEPFMIVGAIAGGSGHRTPAAARIALGLIFLVAGLNGFLDFLPQPSAPIPAGAVALTGALAGTGYLLPLIMGTQVVAGALLLSNRFVPLALALIAPVIVNIAAFHAFLWPSTGGPAAVALVLEVYLAWAYRAAYRPMLAMRVTPGAR